MYFKNAPVHFIVHMCLRIQRGSQLDLRNKEKKRRIGSLRRPIFNFWVCQEIPNLTNCCKLTMETISVKLASWTS